MRRTLIVATFYICGLHFVESRHFYSKLCWKIITVACFELKSFFYSLRPWFWSCFKHMSYLINIFGGDNYQRVVLRKLIQLTETCHPLATFKFIQYAFHLPYLSFPYDSFICTLTNTGLGTNLSTN